MEINLFDKKKRLLQNRRNTVKHFFLILIQLKRGIPKLEPTVSAEFLKEVMEFQV